MKDEVQIQKMAQRINLFFKIFTRIHIGIFLFLLFLAIAGPIIEHCDQLIEIGITTERLEYFTKIILAIFVLLPLCPFIVGTAIGGGRGASKDFCKAVVNTIFEL